MKPGDFIKYRLTKDDEIRTPDWAEYLRTFRGVLLHPDPNDPNVHIRILWNTGEVMIAPIPPYDPDLDFEVIHESSAW